MDKELKRLIKSEFDWEFYVSYYSDLNHITTKSDAWEHYKLYGYNEKRYFNMKEQFKDEMLHSNFDWRFYVSHYPDLNHVTSKYVAWEHYKNYGLKEERHINKNSYQNYLKEIQQKSIEQQRLAEQRLAEQRLAEQRLVEQQRLEGLITDDNYTNELGYILVVMPTYNRSEYIEKSITYMRNQTYKLFKFLIIDDGSNSTHKDVFNNLKYKYRNANKVIFIENFKNCHIAKTLNIGLEYFLSNDKFTHFTWISDDNEYYHNFLNELVTDNYYFKYTSYDIQNINGSTNTNNTNYKLFDDILNNFNGCASFMWTKKAIKKIGFYDENIPGCEDYEYLLRTFKIGERKCVFSINTTMKYVRHSDSLFEKNKKEIMNIKNKITIDYRLKYIDTVSFIKYPDNEYIGYYNDKATNIINLINSIKPLKIEQINQYSIIFDTNLLNHNSFPINDLSKLSEYFLETRYNKIYILNELDYCHLKAFYQINEDTRKLLTNFFINSTYLITFTEIFENSNLQTVGNTSFNKEYSILFFKYAYKVCICDTKNLFYLYDCDIKNNVVYHPPLFHNKNIKSISNNKDIDILFYGSIHETFKYRGDVLKKISNFASEKGYTFKIYNRNLYGEEKDKILERTKIVVHIPSLPKLRTIPWAKISELIIKDVFFIIENNITEYETHEMIFSSYDINYDNNEIKFTNICEVIEYYLQHPEKISESILRNKKNVSRYHTKNMLEYIINYDNLFQKKDKQINNNTNFIAFNYGSNNFHSRLIEQYKKMIEKNDKQFTYYNEEFTKIFGDYYFINCINHDIYYKYTGWLDDCKENKNSLFEIRRKINKFLLDYKENDNNLYIFGAEDLMCFYYHYDASNYKQFYNFINTAKYVIFQCEVIIDNDLITVGFNSNFMTNKYCQDFNLFERNKFLKDIYLNSNMIYICDSKNKYYLESVGVKNIIYHPPYINIPFNLCNNTKKIDCLFYGYIAPSYIDSYRNTMISNIKREMVDTEFIISDNLYDDELAEKINDTKIVLHIPSHENLSTIPWAKISHLMSHKIFFIIEENDEMYNRNMENILVYYKHGDINDLKSKIIKYKDDEIAKQNIVEKCYNYYNKHFGEKKLLESINFYK